MSCSRRCRRVCAAPGSAGSATPSRSRSRPRAAGLADPRVTSDAKHVEIGLTDKADAARWAFAELAAPRDRARRSSSIAGDEFGPVGGTARKRRLPARARKAARATVLSVGAEPTGTPAEVVALGGGPGRFLKCWRTSSSGAAAGTSPSSTAIPTGRSSSRGSTRGWSACTSRCSRSPTAGSARAAHRSSTTPARRRVSCLPASTSGDGSATRAGRLPRLDAALPRAATHRRGSRAGSICATGLLREEGRLTSLRFSSLARPGTVALRAQARPRRAGVSAPAPR